MDQGPAKLLYMQLLEFRFRPWLVRSAPRARETRLGSASAALMKDRRPIIPYWSEMIEVGRFITGPAITEGILI